MHLNTLFYYFERKKQIKEFRNELTSKYRQLFDLFVAKDKNEWEN